jgi:hypothetical protein
MKMRGSSKLLEGGHQMKFIMGAQTFHENVAYKLYEEELARITRDPLEIPPSVNILGNYFSKPIITQKHIFARRTKMPS